MGCLDNLVGVRGCGGSTAEYNVNDLTGITIPDFDKAISPEHSNASAALQDIIRFATKEVIQSISTHLEGKYQLKTFIENGVVGYYYENKETVAAQATYLTGYEIRIDHTPYMEFFLAGLKLFINHTGIVPIYVYDLIQGKLLDTINVTAVAGEIVSLDGLDKSYPTNKQRLHLFIGYQSTFDSYKTSYLSPYISMGQNEECGNNTCGNYRNHYIYFRSAKILSASDKINSSLEGNTYGSGLSLNYSLQCSFKEILCNARNKVALPILYKSGEKTMMELKHSKRLTGVVTIYGKSNEELQAYYLSQHNEKMEEFLMNMSLPNSVCFECTPKVKSRVAVP